MFAFEPQEKIVIPKGTYSFGGCPVYGEEESNAIVMVSQVDWKLVVSAALLSGLLSVLTSVGGLPEVKEN